MESEDKRKLSSKVDQLTKDLASSVSGPGTTDPNPVHVGGVSDPVHVGGVSDPVHVGGVSDVVYHTTIRCRDYHSLNYSSNKRQAHLCS